MWPFIFCRLGGRVDESIVLLTLLYPNLKFNQMTFHQDHCHPFVGFENKVIKELNLPEEKMLEWRSKRNLLPNLQFLEGHVPFEMLHERSCLVALEKDYKIVVL